MNTTTPARDALMDYVLHLTPAQVEKLIERLPLLQEVCSCEKEKPLSMLEH